MKTYNYYFQEAHWFKEIRPRVLMEAVRVQGGHSGARLPAANPAPISTSCMTLGLLLSLFVPRFLHL